MSKTDRILALIDAFCGGSRKQFADLLGVKPQTVSSWITRDSFDMDLIYEKLPGISAKWILSGNGEMLESDSAPVPLEPEHPRLLSEIQPKDVPSSARLLPFYDVDFFAGFPEAEGDQSTTPDDWVVTPGFERATLWCRCHGHSMEPLICNGDLIALRSCTVQDIQYGNVYAVVLDTIRTIKVLRKSATPDASLLYVPINRDDFDVQEFPIDRIQQIYEVIGCTHYLGQ